MVLPLVDAIPTNQILLYSIYPVTNEAIVAGVKAVLNWTHSRQFLLYMFVNTSKKHS
jgi:hypothetical protein